MDEIPLRCSTPGGAGRRPSISGRCCTTTGHGAGTIRAGGAYATGRAHAERMLEGFEWILQIDGYTGYKRLVDDRREHEAPLRLVCCWAHARRKIIKATSKAGSPIAEEALKRIAALYGIEREIHGQGPERRRAMRQKQSVPLLQRARGVAPFPDRTAFTPVRHGQGRRFHPDPPGRAETDGNLVENQIRPLTPSCNNALFAGHEDRASNWGGIASLTPTCKLNGVEHFTYLGVTLEAIAANHSNKEIEDLRSWTFPKAEVEAAT